MNLSWQDKSGEWIEFPSVQKMNILHQQAGTALQMLAGNLPVVMHFDGGYLCTKGIYPQIRKKHKRCITFDTAFAKLKNPEKPLWEALEIGINHENA